MRKKNIIFIIIFSKFLFVNQALAESKSKIIDYIFSFDSFSSKFIQTDQESLSEGRLYLKDKRLKVEYLEPSLIELIISKNKAMYFNKELEEVEYFNPNKTIAKIFYDVFYNKTFFKKEKFSNENTFLVLSKEITIEQINYSIKILFENKPIVIRKVIIESDDSKIDFGIMDIDYNAFFEKKFFSMTHPLIK